MADINDFRDADGKDVQPYFAAYMIERGIARVRDAVTLDYIRWIEAMWNDFRKEIKCGNKIMSASDRAEFMAWLARRCEVA